eukprot:TRINITY_DN1168_c0_g1_i15.p1 TRINITY_DN1168_c0_g1~~TRINITY_DN1168_c0_g1_i15.p1  ORF type:complete len:452 (-),score=147.13 TRINITY_DN1168_c0_g1_i15:169-1524(-)
MLERVKNYIKGLEPWKATAIISASVVAAAGLGYIIYRYCGERRSRSVRKPAEQGAVAAGKRNEKAELLQEVVVEILNCVNGFDGTEEVKREEVPENIYKIAGEITQKVCRRRGIDAQRYSAVINKCLESEGKDLTPEKLLQDMQKGIVMEGILTCDPKCTKRLVINLHKWISILEVYVDYKDVLEYQEIRGDITKDQLERLVKENTPKKLAKRSLILKQKVSVKGFGQDDYFNLVKKPLCKYRLEDSAFDAQVKEVQALCDNMRRLIDAKLVIPEFENDPSELRLEEIPSYFGNLKKNYKDVEQNGLQPMPTGKRGDLEGEDSAVMERSGRTVNNASRLLGESEELKDSLMASDIVRSTSIEESKGEAEEAKNRPGEIFKEIETCDDESFKDSEEEHNNAEEDRKAQEEDTASKPVEIMEKDSQNTEAGSKDDAQQVLENLNAAEEAANNS